MRIGILSVALCLVLLMGCGSAENAVNLFTLQDDIALGEQVRSEIESDSSGMELLDSTEHSKIYGYLYGIRDSLLNSGQVRYKK